jgi:hypothetical protein
VENKQQNTKWLQKSAVARPANQQVFYLLDGCRLSKIGNRIWRI